MFLDKLLYLFYDGYTYGMLLLIIGYYAFRKYNISYLKFIIIANGWYAVYAFTEFCIYTGEIFMSWYSQNPYQGYTFQYSRNNILGPYAWGFFGQLILLLLIATIFCFKKNRSKIWLSVLAIIILKFAYLSELFILYSSLYKDYLPSSFSSYYYINIFRDAVLGILFFAFLTGASYLIGNKMKRIFKV